MFMVLACPKHNRYDISQCSVHIDIITRSRIGNDCTEKSTKFLGMHMGGPGWGLTG